MTADSRRSTAFAVTCCVATLVAVAMTWRSDVPARSQPVSFLPLTIAHIDGPSKRADAVASRILGVVLPQVDAILGVAPTPFAVRVYPTFAAFSAALKRLQDVSPDGDWDSAGNIVHGFLPLAPDVSQAKHRYAHIYSEWVFDRLTHNTTDREPNPAWLYDGLAEAVANRVAPDGLCRKRGLFLVSLRTLANPSVWASIRAEGGGGMEYCEATIGANRIIAHLGWQRVINWLKHAPTWGVFGTHILRRRGSTSLDVATTRRPLKI
jgi:hypothetical protein